MVEIVRALNSLEARSAGTWSLIGSTLLGRFQVKDQTDTAPDSLGWGLGTAKEIIQVNILG